MTHYLKNRTGFGGSFLIPLSTITFFTLSLATNVAHGYKFPPPTPFPWLRHQNRWRSFYSQSPGHFIDQSAYDIFSPSKPRGGLSQSAYEYYDRQGRFVSSTRQTKEDWRKIVEETKVKLKETKRRILEFDGNLKKQRINVKKPKCRARDPCMQVREGFGPGIANLFFFSFFFVKVFKKFRFGCINLFD